MTVYTVKNQTKIMREGRWMRRDDDEREQEL
jgi:hypothetical protein